MNFLMITCKKATLLIIKQEHEKLLFRELVELKIHLFICSICNLFKKQSNFINVNAKHIHEDLKLSAEVKTKIAKSLKD